MINKMESRQSEIISGEVIVEDWVISEKKESRSRLEINGKVSGKVPKFEYYIF